MIPGYFNSYHRLFLLSLLIILAGFSIGYWPVIQKLLFRWESGDNSYCYLIIPLFIYLCWEQKSSFHFSQITWNYFGLGTAIAAVVLLFLGELGSVETLMYLGVWGCFSALLFSLYGFRIRHLIFPLFILLFIVPLPHFINNMLTFQLKMTASTLAVKMLQVVGVSVLQQGNIIDLAVDQLQVADACSGLRYFMPMILTALLVGHFFLKEWWSKVLLVFLVPPLAILINAFRIWLTAVLTVKGHKELAENIFHDFTGWFVFIIGVGFLIAIARILKALEKEKACPPFQDTGGRVPSFLPTMLMASFFCILFTGSGWTLQKLPSSLIIPNRSVFDTFPMEIGTWKGERHYLNEEIMNSLWADDYVNAIFEREESRNICYLLIPYYECQGSQHTAHAPQACLLGSGWFIDRRAEHQVQIEPARTIPIAIMELENGRQRMVASYFFLQRGRVITSPWLNKFYLMWDAVTRKRTDGALVRIEMPVLPEQPMSEVYNELTDFIINLWPQLESYIPS